MAAKRPRFRPNRAGVGEMLRSSQMERAMRNRAEEVRRRAEGYAPEHSGVYKQSFRIESTRRGGVRGDRAEARVINSAPHAAAVEWGNARTPRYRPLGRAAGAGEAS